MSPNLKACWDSWTGAVPRLKQPGYVTREARAGYSFGAEETGKEGRVDSNLEKGVVDRLQSWRFCGR